MGFIPRSQGWFSTCRSINVIHHINKRQKLHSYLNRYRKNTWQNLTSIHHKNSCQSGYRKNISQNAKSYLWQTHSQYNTQWCNIKSLTFKIWNNTGCPLFLLLFHTVLEVLATIISQKNRNKIYPNLEGKGKIVIMCRWYTIHRKLWRLHTKTTRTDKWIQQGSRIPD